MKKIFKILFAFLAPVWLAFSCAHAEEVELSPSDSVSVTQTINGTDFFQSPKTVTVNQESLSSCPSNNKWAKGSLLQTDYKTFYQSQGSGSRNSVYCNLYQSEYFKGFYDFTLSTDTCIISLDTSGLIPGYYRYECDLYFGMSFQGLQYTTTNLTLDPTFTYSSAPVALSDSDGFAHGMLYLVGQDSNPCICDDSGSINTIDSHLVHVRLESTFLLSQGDILVKWNIGAGLSYLFSDFSYDLSSVRAYNNSRYLNAYFSNRFKSSLYGNVDPPVTPTPTPTPSPNQDIINNDNTNTTNIISSINDGFDALSAAFEGAIYGLTDLFFGSASDWIDFFSDVQDDMEEYLPVVSFFQSCKNILANFFNVQSTDPTALQFVAGWQSDIYTLHIGALPLVLPEGTYNFFPEVNFDLNNPFMNEIRPYWLTFSNVLITLLFLRYLANYLFRWTQLLTGDTSVAFQLFHHAPDELENLGTDPYDLAGDYSYDSIDSANHDLYQDVEAHYGHGAARYLSKVFHSK